jgi:hypothetical protein
MSAAARIALSDRSSYGKGASASKWQRFVCLSAVAAPALVVLQPLIGGLAASTILATRMLLPVGLAAFVRRAVHAPSVLLLLALIVATGIEGIAYRGQDFALVASAVFGAIVLYRVGVIAASRPGVQYIWAALVHGISLLNAVTLLVLVAATMGLIDIVALFEPLQRDLDFGLARFSLGNPIEVPFISCALLYAALRHAPANSSYIGASFLNLATAVISESRIVVLIALLMFVGQWMRSQPVAKIVSVSALIGLLALNWELLVPLVDSITARFSGQDFGSGEDRAFLVSVVLQGLDPLTLLIGNGLTSGAELVRKVAGTYRTVESSLLQLLYELGIFGLALTWAAVRLGLPKQRRVSMQLHPVSALLWVQLTLFLPVSNLMPMAAFALGALAVASQRHR